MWMQPLVKLNIWSLQQGLPSCLGNAQQSQKRWTKWTLEKEIVEIIRVRDEYVKLAKRMYLCCAILHCKLLVFFVKIYHPSSRLEPTRSAISARHYQYAVVTSQLRGQIYTANECWAIFSEDVRERGVCTVRQCFLKLMFCSKQIYSLPVVEKFPLFLLDKYILGRQSSIFSGEASFPLQEKYD